VKPFSWLNLFCFFFYDSFNLFRESARRKISLFPRDLTVSARTPFPKVKALAYPFHNLKRKTSVASDKATSAFSSPLVFRMDLSFVGGCWTLSYLSLHPTFFHLPPFPDCLSPLFLSPLPHSQTLSLLPPLSPSPTALSPFQSSTPHFSSPPFPPALFRAIPQLFIISTTLSLSHPPRYAVLLPYISLSTRDLNASFYPPPISPPSPSTLRSLPSHPPIIFSHRRYSIPPLPSILHLYSHSLFPLLPFPLLPLPTARFSHLSFFLLPHPSLTAPLISHPCFASSSPLPPSRFVHALPNSSPSPHLYIPSQFPHLQFREGISFAAFLFPSPSPFLRWSSHFLSPRALSKG